MNCSYCGEEIVYGDHRNGYECELVLNRWIETLYRRIRKQDEDIKKLKKLVEEVTIASRKEDQ